MCIECERYPFKFKNFKFWGISCLDLCISILIDFSFFDLMHLINENIVAWKIKANYVVSIIGLVLSYPFFTNVHIHVTLHKIMILQAKESSGHSQSSSTQSTSTSTSRGSGGVSGGGASSGSSSSGPNQPVEFNHAISYVNKIKVNYFSNLWTHPLDNQMYMYMYTFQLIQNGDELITYWYSCLGVGVCEACFQERVV